MTHKKSHTLKTDVQNKKSKLSVGTSGSMPESKKEADKALEEAYFKQKQAPKNKKERQQRREAHSKTQIENQQVKKEEAKKKKADQAAYEEKFRDEPWAQ